MLIPNMIFNESHMHIFVVYMSLKVNKSQNDHINLLPLTIWGNQTLLFLNE